MYVENLLFSLPLFLDNKDLDKLGDFRTMNEAWVIQYVRELYHVVMRGAPYEAPTQSKLQANWTF